MLVRLLSDQTGPDGAKPAGTLIDHPEADILCQLGIAEPADAEAEHAHALWLDRKAASEARRAEAEAEKAREARRQREEAQAAVDEARRADFERRLMGS